MELSLNTSNFKFTDYSRIRDQLNRNVGPSIKRLQVRRNKQFLSFNKWFSKEHDYCLPVKPKNNVSTETHFE